MNSRYNAERILGLWDALSVFKTNRLEKNAYKGTLKKFLVSILKKRGIKV